MHGGHAAPAVVHGPAKAGHYRDPDHDGTCFGSVGTTPIVRHAWCFGSVGTTPVVRHAWYFGMSRPRRSSVARSVSVVSGFSRTVIRNVPTHNPAPFRAACLRRGSRL